MRRGQAPWRARSRRRRRRASSVASPRQTASAPPRGGPPGRSAPTASLTAASWAVSNQPPSCSALPSTRSQTRCRAAHERLRGVQPPGLAERGDRGVDFGIGEAHSAPSFADSCCPAVGLSGWMRVSSQPSTSPATAPTPAATQLALRRGQRHQRDHRGQHARADQIAVEVVLAQQQHQVRNGPGAQQRQRGAVAAQDTDRSDQLAAPPRARRRRRPAPARSPPRARGGAPSAIP